MSILITLCFPRPCYWVLKGSRALYRKAELFRHADSGLMSQIEPSPSSKYWEGSEDNSTDLKEQACAIWALVQ